MGFKYENQTTPNDCRPYLTRTIRADLNSRALFCIVLSTRARPPSHYVAQVDCGGGWNMMMILHSTA